MRPNPLAIIVFLCGAFTGIFAVYAWRHRGTRGSTLFSLFMASVTIYILGYSMELASLNLGTMLLWSKVGYLGVFSFPTIFLLFVLQYTGRDHWLRLRYVLILFLFPSLLLIAKLTDDFTHLVYATTWVDTSGSIPLLGFTRGPIYPMALYAVIPTVLAITLMWQKRQNQTSIFRRQGLFVILSAAPPLLLFIFYMSGFQPFPMLKYLDLNVFLYALWGIGIGWAAFRYRLFDLVPIARDTVFERLNDGVVVLDDQSRLVDVNPAGLRMIGLPRDSIGRLAADVFPVWKDLHEAYAAAGAISPYKAEIQQNADGDPSFYDVNISALHDEMGRGMGRLIVIHDVTETKLSEKSLLKLTVFEERQRLARNLHDSVNQSIFGMVLFSETLLSALDKDNLERARAIAGRLQESARQSLKETRLMLYEMQPVDVDRAPAFLPDLENRLSTVERHAGIDATIEMEGSLACVPQAWFEDLFWIAIEALNNSLKHAQAHAVHISLRCAPRDLEMEVVDDGKGFDLNQFPNGGMGLRNMRERARLLGGALTIHSQPGQGCRVCFRSEILSSEESHGSD